MWPAMRKGTVRSSRLSMKHDQFYHDNDQLAFYKCSVVNTLVSAYWHQHTVDTAYYYSLHTIRSCIRQTRIPNGPFSQSWSHIQSNLCFTYCILIFVQFSGSLEGHVSELHLLWCHWMYLLTHGLIVCLVVADWNLYHSSDIFIIP